jgi:DivIVA domain-containing protein
VKRKETPAEGSGFEQGSPARVTPLDIQEKTFRTARLGGGYQVREVDEFLDQVTDALSALIAENERLRTTTAKGSSAPEAPAPTPSAIGAGDRAAVDSFLQRERTFLQSLGGLVQEHAEVLREMARSARQAPAHEVSPEPSTQAVGTPPTIETVDEGAASEPQHAAVVEEAVAAAPAVEAEPEAPIEVEGEDVSASVEQPPPAEEPIRLEETQPVRSRTEGEQEPSLRELFWGEE